MPVSHVLALSCVLTLAFAIVYAERRTRALYNEVCKRDECLRYAVLLSAHRAGDRELVEVIEGFGPEDDEVATAARRDAFGMLSADLTALAEETEVRKAS